MESLISQRDRSKKPALNSPLHGLRPHWVLECDDGGPEVRIAAALASIRATGKVGPIRSNLAGVDPSAPWKWAAGHGQQRWRGSNLVERLGNVLQQRLMDAERFSAPSFPVEAGVRLSPNDLVPFLLGETDDQRIEELMWGFTLVDWWAKGREELKHLWREKIDTGPLPRGWCAMKLLHLPGGVRGKSIRLEPRIVSLLTAGRIQEAVKVAYDRLRVSDLRPLPVEEDNWIESGRQLAGLLVPTRDQWMLESQVLEKTQPEEG